MQALRERIRTGRIVPGQRLRVDELTRELGMSPTPIREALRLLQADGLVDYRAHHGIVVTEVSARQTSEVYRLRLLLEPRAVEIAVRKMTPLLLEELERLHERHATAVNSKRGSAISERNWAWHWAIYDASESPILIDFLRRLWEAFPWRTMWTLPGRTTLSLEQHAVIMEEIRVGDARRAASKMYEHIASGEETLLLHLQRELAASS